MSLPLPKNVFLEQAGLQILLAATQASKNHNTEFFGFDGADGQSDLNINDLLQEALSPGVLELVLSSAHTYLKVQLDVLGLQNTLSKCHAPNSKYNINLLVRKLAKNHAPFPMMRSLFKIGRKHWRELNDELGLRSENSDLSGRPTAATLKEAEEINKVFLDSIQAHRSRHIGYAVLAVFDQTKIPLKTIWAHLVSEFRENGQIKIESGNYGLKSIAV